MERCINDAIFYKESLASYWYRTIDFLTKVGESGIVLNPKKFQFSQQEVAFAGFKVSIKKFNPFPKYLDAIKILSTP